MVIPVNVMVGHFAIEKNKLSEKPYVDGHMKHNNLLLKVLDLLLHPPIFPSDTAEALVYGEAEGGENDENLFRGICLLLDPPLSTAEMSNQARWSVLQSYNLLKWHRAAHRAAIKALESGGSMSGSEYGPDVKLLLLCMYYIAYIMQMVHICYALSTKADIN
ncbi:hypothetical protein V8G54_025846 [Vigna mungo]|uniref:Uncharacterized protein n=1 Tax=Vigna mungo TaxID=3915 RepID=A0AAQ3RMN2_VIGMU